MTEDLGTRSHVLQWLAPAGLVIALFGLVSYFTLFAKVPALRDNAWLNLGLVSLGAILTVSAFWRRRNLWRGAAVVVAVVAGALLFWYVFGLSAHLPDSASAVALGETAPAFELAADDGGTVGSESFPERALLVVFYRGFW